VQFFRDLARAAEMLFAKENAANFTVCIGRDTRASGEPLFDALLRGFSAGAIVLDCGIIPTPAIAAVTVSSGADLGIAITASHNPGWDNGIKFFNATGEKLSVEQELRMERLLGSPSVLKRRRRLPRASAQLVDFRDSAVETYVGSYENFLPPDALLGRTVALDLANGATCAVAEKIFKKFGANVAAIGNCPDGKNINAGCGSEHPEALAKFVESSGAFMGIAYDGDGDRAVILDEAGDRINGDTILGAVARHMFEAGELENCKIVATAQSNLGLDAYLNGIGIEVIRCDVGDRNVYRTMLGNGCAFGGENSGHLIFKKFSSVGDGIRTSLYVLSLAMKNSGKLSQLKTKIALLPQRSFNVTVRKKVPISRIKSLGKDIKNADAKLSPPKRILMRYSGTEPKLRVLIESSDQNSVDDAWCDLKKSIIERMSESGIDASIL
jgi:phosphoglucosamine mutase